MSSIWKEDANAPKTPCTRECPNRCADPNCHGTCEKYIRFKQEYDEYRNMIREAKDRERDAREYSQARSRQRWKRIKKD